jgi:hypothetical protein
MPNRGSWNGQWSGQNNLYAVVRDFKKDTAEKILSHSSYYYRWDDGWGASIAVRKVDGVESRKIKKASQGFCGYEWMIDSIVEYGKIYADHQKPKAVAVDTGTGQNALSDNRSVAEPVSNGKCPTTGAGMSDWERASRGLKDRP